MSKKTRFCKMETPKDYGLIATFVAVADENSFSKAAAKLGLSKGTVSRAIARLETNLGVELIHRTTHDMSLSTAGVALYERTGRHLKALDTALTALPDLADQPSGLLRLAAPGDICAVVLPRLISQFSLRYPEVSFDLRTTNVTRDLVGEGIDVAIHAMGASLKDSTLKVRRLAVPRGGFYASPAYLARRGRPKALDAPDHDWVFHSAIVALWKLQDLPRKFLVDDFLLARDLMRDGAGVGPLLTFIAEPYVREGLLEPVPILPPSAVRGSYVLLYPSSGQVSKKVAAFRDFVVEWVRRHPF